MQNLKFKICNLKFEICNSQREGFTFLEIMIALAIIGAVIVTIFHTVNYHADVAYENNITTKMFFMAKEKLFEMKLNSKKTYGIIPGTDFTYENLVNTTEDKEIIELKTIIRGYGKKIVLSELVVKEESQYTK